MNDNIEGIKMENKTNKKIGGFENFKFRASRDSSELEQLLKIRYRAFRNARNFEVVSFIRSGMELNSYDPYSHHLGLFGIDQNGMEVPVGYIRLITTESSPQNDQIFEIINNDRELERSLLINREEFFPSVKVLPGLKRYIDLSDDGIETFTEPSRLSFSPLIRSARLVVSLALASFAYSLKIKKKNSILTTRDNHAKMYRLLGFRECWDFDYPYVLDYGCNCVGMILSEEIQGQYLRNVIEENYSQLVTNNCVRIQSNRLPPGRLELSDSYEKEPFRESVVSYL